MFTNTIAPTVQIQCIRKIDRYDPWERITHVGGLHNGSRWVRTQEQAINDIETDRVRYLTIANRKSVSVKVARSRFGHKYLITEADGSEGNNLLSLPECP